MPRSVPMPLQRGFALLTSVALALGAMVPFVAPASVQASSHVWINEFHYDDDGTDAGEAVEVAGVAGTDLTGWSIVLYNGTGGALYDTDFLAGALPDQQGGFGTMFVDYPLNGVQNGAPDGIALVDATGSVVQFLSYEGSFTAVDGPADGMTSTDIGVFEPSNSPDGDSLQLTGVGGSYGAFTWTAADATLGAPNFGQTFASGLVVTDCGDDVSTPAGTAATTSVSASDVDGTVTSISVASVEPTPSAGSVAVTSFTAATSAGGTAEATLTIGADVPAGVYTVTVEAANADASPQTGQCTLSVTVFDPTEIAEIQGVGHLSPLDGAQVFEVEGVVTAIRTGRSGGFWMSDPTPDTDPNSSDGIFVFNRATPAVAIGDLVHVNGTVDEFRPFFEDLTITEIVGPTWTTASSDNALPTVTVGVDRFPPTMVIDNDSTSTVEANDAVYDPAEDGIDFWETMEGMRVAVADAVAVGPTNDFGEIAVISQLQTGTGEFTARGGLIVRNLDSADDTGDYQSGDFNPERLLLDDLLGDTPEVNVGDEFATDPVGVLDQSFGAFKLLVTNAPEGIDNGLSRESAAPAGAQELAVATFNVENLSAVDCQNEPEKVAGLANQIVNNLRSPDLIAIEEMQDNSGDVDDDPDGDDGTVAADQSWQCLINAIVDAGGPVYDYRQIDPENNADGGVPGGNIRVGFLFHSERGLEFVDRAGGDAVTDTNVVSSPSGTDAQLTISPGRVLDASLGGDKAFLDTRKSLAGEFRFRGETIFVIANHFSSKGDDRPLYSVFQPPFRLTEFESGDPEDGWRHAQAQAVNDFVDEILAVDADAHVIVLGDLNDFDFSETVKVLTGERLAVAGDADPDGSGPTVDGDGIVMRTLFEGLPAQERYSYVFEGNSQVLDQILVSNSLWDVGTTYDVVHVNAEFADQVSDHDPSVMKVAFQPTPDLLKPRGH